VAGAACYSSNHSGPTGGLSRGVRGSCGDSRALSSGDEWGGDMFRRRWLAVAVLGFAQVAGAQELEQEISKGLNLVGLTLSFGHTSMTFEQSTTPGSPTTPDSSTTSAMVGLAFERLITDKVGLAGGLTYHRLSYSGLTEGSNGFLAPLRFADWSSEVSAATTYYWRPINDGSPYATARCGVLSGGDTSLFSFSARVWYLKLLGAKRRGAALNAEIAVIHYVYSGGSSNVIAMGAGLGFYFRSKH
jgi:hypothetical protein